MADLAKVDWDTYAADYDVLRLLKPYDDMLRLVAGFVCGVSGLVVDVGCGTGNLSSLLDSTKPDRHIVAFDRSKEMLAIARRKCPRVAFYEGDLDEPLVLKDATCDAIVSTNVLYTLADPAASMREFARVLKPGARLVVTTPKSGQDNGLILKAHCNSGKSNAHWMGIDSLDRAYALLVEAGIADVHIPRFLSVWEINQLIAAQRTYSFFTAGDLSQLFIDSGFTLELVGQTYADQCHLIVAIKSR